MMEESTEDRPRDTAPSTVAGGWQGLDVVDRTDPCTYVGEGEEEGGEKDERIVARVASRFPRCYHVFFKVIVPLFILIGISFICGAGLAHLESKEEKKANDQAISDFRDLFFQLEVLNENLRTSALVCLDRFNSTTGSADLINATELREHLKLCGEELAEEKENVETQGQSLLEYLLYQVNDAATFNWMTCLPENASRALSWQQSAYVGGQWEASYQSLLKEYQSQGKTWLEAHELARQEATGSENCETNAAAGALFWFTIMTTIGYGHTTPATFGGRLLVYTMGFLSILVFTALIGQAAYICITIFDDAFLRLKLRRLVHGPVSILFWLCTLILWMLVVAGIFIWWVKKRANFDFPLQDAYWFTYITTTTVGLGDISIPPDLFKAADMFFIPLLFLLAFVFLANFLLKLSENLLESFSHLRKGPSIEMILESSRKLGRKEEETEKNMESGDTDRDAVETTSNKETERNMESGDADRDAVGTTSDKETERNMESGDADRDAVGTTSDKGT